MSGFVRDSIIADGDFIKLGDSGVVSVGELPEASPEDGTSVPTFPSNVTIARNHFGQFGVFGKQTSALFIAVSKQISFVDNVLYDGPRAGVNINDGFGGGNVVVNRLLLQCPQCASTFSTDSARAVAYKAEEQRAATDAYTRRYG